MFGFSSIMFYLDKKYQFKNNYKVEKLIKTSLIVQVKSNCQSFLVLNSSL